MIFPNNFLKILLLICLMITPIGRISDAAESSDYGTIKGSITVWKTRVKTHGPKSDKDVIVSLEDMNGKTYSPAEENIVSMDQKGLVFIPHVLPIQKGTTVRFLNNDTVKHNVYLLFEETGETTDIGTYEQGVSVDYKFNNSGVIIALCKLHLEMAAYIIVFNNPLFCLAEIDEDTQSAVYALNNIPPGRYRIKIWHKNLKMKQKQAEIKVENGQEINLDIVITKSKYAQ